MTRAAAAPAADRRPEGREARARCDLIEELEEVIAGHDIGHRARMLRRVTDLFALSSDRLSEEQMALFDDVMGRLVSEIDVAARAAFGSVLARMPSAPRGVVRRLALDDSIGVAGPVLAHSDRVDDMTLIESASTKSQRHLLAIACRKKLAAPVTDILVTRGDRDVVLSAAENPGAAFSEFGYATLVQRAATHEALAVSTWSRPEIPRQHLLRLFAEASEAVKQTLTKKDPSRAAVIAEAVAQASTRIQTQVREASTDYAAAEARVRALHDAGELDETTLAAFAQAGRFDETIVALSLLCDLPVGLVEHAFAQESPAQIIVLARANDLAWDTAKTILKLQAGVHGSAQDRERAFEAFMRLKVETAKKAVGFYRLRARAVAPRPA